MISTPFFSDCMARNIFHIITCFLHFNTMQGCQSTQDKLFKLQQIVTLLTDGDPWLKKNRDTIP